MSEKSSDGLSSDGSFLKTESSAQPITSTGRIIFERTLFGRIILQTELSAQPITAIVRIIFGRIIFGRTFFGRIILRSETLKIITSHEWSRTARVTQSRSLTLVQHVIKRDGRKRSKKLLYAQKPYVYVHNNLLYAQKPYVYIRIKLYIVRTSRTSYAEVASSA